MPKIENIEFPKKFKKSNYRPWNFLDELENEHKVELTHSNENSATLEDRVEINRKQTVNKLETNCKQIVNKLETNRKQTESSQNLNRKQTVSTTVNKTVNKLETNRKQTVNRININSFSYLTGLQRSSILFIYEECKTNRSHITNFISLEHFAEHLKTSVKTTKTTIQRLVKKGCLLRTESKVGRGGVTRYMLTETVFQELLHSETVNKLETNRKQTVSTTVSTTVNKPPSSSSNIYNIKTTTTELPENWSNFDLSMGEVFGFTNNHLMQLYKHGGFEPKFIQESIQHFAFDLETNNKIKDIKTNPLSYFMGILKRVGSYAPPDNYESPREHGMRVYLEKQKVIEAKRAAMEKELLHLAFQNWIRGLTEHDKEQILPVEVKNMGLEAPKTAALRTHFEKTVWASKKEEIISEMMSEV